MYLCINLCLNQDHNVLHPNFFSDSFKTVFKYRICKVKQIFTLKRGEIYIYILNAERCHRNMLSLIIIM